MKHLQAQLSDSLKELHQKELRIQQLNSKVLIHILHLLAVRDKECGEGWNRAQEAGMNLSLWAFNEVTQNQKYISQKKQC